MLIARYSLVKNTCIQYNNNINSSNRIVSSNSSSSDDDDNDSNNRIVSSDSCSSDDDDNDNKNRIVSSNRSSSDDDDDNDDNNNKNAFHLMTYGRSVCHNGHFMAASVTLFMRMRLFLGQIPGSIRILE